MSRLLKVVCSAVVLLGIGILAASCGSSSAQYRIVNAIAQPYGTAYSLDIYVNNPPQTNTTTTPTPTYPAVAFQSTVPASNYAKVTSGTDPLQVFQTTEISNPYISSALNLGGGTDYTIVLTGSSNATNAQYPYVARINTDTNPTPNTGQLMFRVMDASISLLSVAPNGVDVYLIPSEATCCSGTPAASGLSYPTSSSSGNFSGIYVNVGVSTSNNLTAWVVSHGTNSVIASSPTYAVSAGQLHTLVVTDAPGGNSPPQFVLLTP